jgi:hypothetical protein
MSEVPPSLREPVIGDSIRVRFELSISELYEAQSLDVAYEDSSTVTSCKESGARLVVRDEQTSIGWTPLIGGHNVRDIQLILAL